MIKVLHLEDDSLGAFLCRRNEKNICNTFKCGFLKLVFVAVSVILSSAPALNSFQQNYRSSF